MSPRILAVACTVLTAVTVAIAWLALYTVTVTRLGGTP